MNAALFDDVRALLRVARVIERGPVRFHVMMAALWRIEVIFHYLNWLHFASAMALIKAVTCHAHHWDEAYVFERLGEVIKNRFLDLDWSPVDTTCESCGKRHGVGMQGC